MYICCCDILSQSLVSYKLGKTLGPAYDMLSPFACLSGKDNSHVSKGEIQVINSSKHLTSTSDCQNVVLRPKCSSSEWVKGEFTDV